MSDANKYTDPGASSCEEILEGLFEYYTDTSVQPRRLPAFLNLTSLNATAQTQAHQPPTQPQQETHSMHHSMYDYEPIRLPATPATATFQQEQQNMQQAAFLHKLHQQQQQLKEKEQKGRETCLQLRLEQQQQQRQLLPSMNPNNAQQLKLQQNQQHLRHVREDNLVKLWTVYSVLNEKPELLVDCKGDTLGDFTGGLSLSGDKQTLMQKKRFMCSFCLKNGELPIVYEGHNLKDFDGNVVCPILQKHTCEVCGASGRKAHTRKHCPRNREKQDRLPPFRLLANGAISSSHNHK